MTLLVDCRPRTSYEEGHVPGAAHLDPEDDLTGEIGDVSRGRHPLPEPADFAAAATRAGIGEGVFVLAYDEGTGWADRLWWLLRHFGHDACATFDLRSYKGPLVAPQKGEAAASTRSPAAFVPRARTDDVIEADELLARIGDPDLVVLDGRARERWLGNVEPLDPVAGRIPGSHNAFFEEPVPDAFVAAPELAVYCGSGVTAAVQAHRLVRAGRDDVRLYPGSFSEWCRRPDYPIERGEPT